MAYDYELKVELPSYHTYIIDVSRYIVYRLPMLKDCSLARLQAYVPTHVISYIYSDLAENKRIDCVVTLDEYNDQKQLVRSIQRRYRILEMREINRIQTRVPFNLVDFVLVNPIFHTMSNKYVGAVCWNNVTSSHVLDLYMRHIVGVYGANLVNVQTAGWYPTPHVYEQILVDNSISDLHVPNWLIEKYKFFEVPTVVFFDDYDVPDTKLISMFIVAYWSHSDFEPHDVQTGEDAVLAHEVRSYTISDKLNIFGKEQPTFMINTPSGTYVVRQKGSGSVDLGLGQTRQNVPAEDIVVLDVPDEPSIAINRFNKVASLVKDRLEAIVQYRVFQSKFDQFSFTQSYNLDMFNQNMFLFAPIGLVHTFIKPKARAQRHIQIVDGVFVKFKYNI